MNWVESLRVEMNWIELKEHNAQENIQRNGCYALGTLAKNGKKRREVISMSFYVYVLACACKCLV